MSRTHHHTKLYRKALYDQRILPWWKLKDGPPVQQKTQWVRTIRTQHKFAFQRANQRDLEDLVLEHPRRLTHLWDWI